MKLIMKEKYFKDVNYTSSTDCAIVRAINEQYTDLHDVIAGSEDVIAYILNQNVQYKISIEDNDKVQDMCDYGFTGEEFEIELIEC